MAEIAMDRKQRLRTLENTIRKNYEQFVATGFALKEIRDDDLYKEDGFETWDRYLKERVGAEFEIEERQARKLIACAQIRTKLPDIGSQLPIPDGQSEKAAWGVEATYEFSRLAPKDETKPAHPYDFDRLDRRDAARVAKKVIEHCQEEGEKPTATIVRRFVDEELGIDRAAKAQETRRRNEDESAPELREYLVGMTGRLESDEEKLKTITEEAWTLFREDNPKTIKRLIAACDSLAELLRSVGE